MSKNKILWKIHNWTGLYVGIVIGILSLTGAVAVFIPDIDGLLERKYRISETHGDYYPMDSILDQIAADYADFSLSRIYHPQHAEDPLTMYLLKQDGPGGWENIKVFVNPYNGEILGSKDHYNSLSNYLRQVHVRLMDGWYGRQLVGIAGIGLLVICITGLLIYGNFMKRQFFGQLRNGRGIRILMADWHKMIGIAALVFNLMIAITGAWLGLQPRLMQWINMKTPNIYVRIDKPLDSQSDKKHPFDYYAAIDMARSSISGFEPSSVSISSDGSRMLTIWGDIKGTAYEPDINKVVIDKADNHILFKYDVREQSLGHKLYFVQEGLHFGRFGGMGVKIAYLLLGLTSAFLSISGFVIYLKRKAGKKVEGSLILRRVYVYSLSITIALILTGWATIAIGYTMVTAAITPAVYVFLVVLILYYTFITFIRPKPKPKNKPKKMVYDG